MCRAIDTAFLGPGWTHEIVRASDVYADCEEALWDLCLRRYKNPADLLGDES